MAKRDMNMQASHIRTDHNRTLSGTPSSSSSDPAAAIEVARAPGRNIEVKGVNNLPSLPRHCSAAFRCLISDRKRTAFKLIDRRWQRDPNNYRYMISGSRRLVMCSTSEQLSGVARQSARRRGCRNPLAGQPFGCVSQVLRAVHAEGDCLTYHKVDRVRHDICSGTGRRTSLVHHN